MFNSRKNFDVFLKQYHHKYYKNLNEIAPLLSDGIHEMFNHIQQYFLLAYYLDNKNIQALICFARLLILKNKVIETTAMKDDNGLVYLYIAKKLLKFSLLCIKKGIIGKALVNDIPKIIKQIHEEIRLTKFLYKSRSIEQLPNDQKENTVISEINQKISLKIDEYNIETVFPYPRILYTEKKPIDKFMKYQ